jgi:SAM-dependent methyltransferase
VTGSGDRRSLVTIGREAIERLRAGLERGPGSAGPLGDLFVRERGVPAAAFERAGSLGLLSALESLGLVTLIGGQALPQVRIDVVADSLVASDLLRYRRAPDFVAGPSAASFTLGRHVRRPAGGRLLDLGCGPGTLGLLLGAARTPVVGIDVNPRALDYAAFNVGLNGRHRVQVAAGDFLGEPLDGSLQGRFATVVANPPFVLAPQAELIYRDRPLAGDEVGARTVEQVARALAAGGRGYVLCNWIDRGKGWAAPVREWISRTGCSGTVVRLASYEPPAYAAIWCRDIAPDRRRAAIAEWATALRTEGIDLIHIGVVALTPAARTRRRVTALEQCPAGSPWLAVEAALAA